MEQVQGVSAVGGSRGVREGAVQAFQIFFVLFVMIVLARAFVSYYHTFAQDEAQPAKRAKAPAAAPAAAPAPAAPAKTAAPVKVEPARGAERTCPVMKFTESHPLTTHRLPIFILIVLLAARLMLGQRQLDRLYTESDAWAERSFTGFLAHAAFLLAQGALLVFLAVGLEAEGTNEASVFFFIGILIVAGLWYLWTWLTAGRQSRPLMGFALPAGVCDLAFAAITFGGLLVYAAVAAPRPGAGVPASFWAFIGMANVYVNYLIAVSAPNDAAATAQHVSRSWLAVGVGAAAAGLIFAALILMQVFG